MRKTALVPYTGGRNDLARLLDMTDRFFGDRLIDRVTTQGGDLRLGTGLDVYEVAEGYYLELDVPGVSKEALAISLERSRLTIKAGRPAPAVEGRTYSRSERTFGEFQRLIDLPAEIDAERIDATLKDGVLTLFLPKAETQKTRSIPVTLA
jgi:HSP20 family protein